MTTAPSSVPIQFAPVRSAHAASAGWLHVVPHVDPRFGGITAAVPELSNAVTQAGVDTHAAAFCEPDEAAGDRWSVKPEVFPFGRVRWLSDSRLRRRLHALIAASAGVHIHGLWQEHCSLAASACRALRKPYVISAHGMLESWAVGNKSFKKRVYSALVENRNLSGASCLHALTESEVEDYRRAGLRNPVAVIPNGIELPPASSPALFHRHFPQAGGGRIVLFLSRLHYKKGLDILIRAWADVQRKHTACHLVLAGPDFSNTRAGIEQMVRDLSLTGSVTFTGMLQGDLKWSALSAASVYVLPSYSEGFSVAVLEGLAMGKPAIVTDRCNVPEVVQAACGWQIKPDQRELSMALDAALTMDDGALAAMGSRGRTLVAGNFQWSSVGKRMAAVYKWIEGGQTGGLQLEEIRFVS